LGIYLQQNKIDICFLTESWLNDKIENFLLSYSGTYNVIRQDRLDRTGGGVCILIKQGINFMHLHQMTFSQHNCEVISMKLIGQNIKVTFILGYRPPNNTNENDKLLIQKLTDTISKLKENHHIVMLGDFNYPNIKWNEDKFLHENRKFYNFVINQKFKQLVTAPTMFKSENINDILLVRNEDIIFENSIDN